MIESKNCPEIKAKALQALVVLVPGKKRWTAGWANGGVRHRQ